MPHGEHLIKAQWGQVADDLTEALARNGIDHLDLCPFADELMVEVELPASKHISLQQLHDLARDIGTTDLRLYTGPAYESGCCIEIRGLFRPG